MGKQARNSRREAERDAQREAALRSRRRHKLLPYWIGAGSVLVVIAVVISVLLTSGGSAPASILTSLQTFPENNHKHVTGFVTYDRTPPAGGAHSVVWQNCGIYEQPIQNEHAVHSIEHGAVWITYQPDLSAAAVTQLQAFVRAHAVGSQGYLLVSPYPGMRSPVVASTWGAQIALSGANDPRLAAFVTRYAGGGQGGERGGECIGGTGSPL